MAYNDSLREPCNKMKLYETHSQMERRKEGVPLVECRLRGVGVFH